MNPIEKKEKRQQLFVVDKHKLYKLAKNHNSLMSPPKKKVATKGVAQI
jgi:hypothetical protein